MHLESVNVLNLALWKSECVTPTINLYVFPHEEVQNYGLKKTKQK